MFSSPLHCVIWRASGDDLVTFLVNRKMMLPRCGNTPSISILIISISICLAAAQHRRSGRWHITRISQRARLSGSQRIASDYDLTFIPKSTTKYPVNIYVVDSGVRISHEEFENRAELGPDFVDSKSRIMDCQGHGTGVASLAAGKYSGIARTARIISVRVLDCEGNGYCRDVVRALDWVSKDITRRNNNTDNYSIRARSIIIMSLGSRDGSCSPTKNQTRVLEQKGVLIFGAAGNARQDSCEVYPSRNDAVISVGATDMYDRIYKKNNYGKCIDLWAPGVQVTAAWGNVSNTKYSMLGGTSFAAPFVAGTAALILGADNRLSATEVRQIMLDSATLNAVRNRSDSDRVMTGSRLLYTPWARFFDDVPRDGRRDDGSGTRWDVLVLDLIPRVTPAMSNTANALIRACKGNCTRGTIKLRRISTTFKNGTEPPVVRLHLYTRGCDTVHFDQVKRLVRENISLRTIRRNIPIPKAVSTGRHAEPSFELDSLSILLLAVLGWILLLVIIALGTCWWKNKLPFARRRSPSGSNSDAPKAQDEQQVGCNKSGSNSADGGSVVAVCPASPVATESP